MSFAAASPADRRSGAFAASVVGSLVLHGAIIAAFLSLRPARQAAAPPIYRVNLIAAAPGPAAVGVVTPTTPVVETETPTPPRPKTDDVAPIQVKTPPRRVPKLATPSVSDTKVARNAPAPVAAGGEEGGKGTDVANIRTEGIDFPFPGYLENIVRQIALRFKPPRGSPLKAEVSFFIRRDGTISPVQFIQRSGSFTFDLEAQGAVDAAARYFGPLPAGWKDDVLPVRFSFDPNLIR